MAIYKPVISIIGYGPGNGLELFVSTDIYRYDVDNRPLENLADNDVALKGAIDELVDEIQDAYTGKNWPVGSAYVYAALDPRLDNMDLVLQNFTDVRNVQYSAFVQLGNYLRERYTSGFMNGPYPDKFVRSNYAMENNEFMPAPFGGMYIPERSFSVKNQNVPDKVATNQISIETRIEPDGSSREYDSGKHYASRKPLYAIMNGYVVPVFNAAGGTLAADQSIDGKCTSGNWGPISINFPAAPASGHRFDFAFLEMWLKQVDPATGVFYPYGAADWAGWDFPTLDITAGNAQDYSGAVDNRELVKFTETHTEGGKQWGFRVYKRTTDYENDPINWLTDDPVDLLCEDNGLGALIEKNSSGCTGTINYETGAWTLHFNTPLANGKYLVAIYAWNAVTSASHWAVKGTLTFLSNGNYLQVQYRIRVVPGVDYESYPDWFSDPTVEARAAKDAPVANYTYTNMLNVLHDGTLWRAGNGDSGSVTDLGTQDGHVYALPLCVWSRFNTQAWSITEQNGGTGRPDGLAHNIPDDRHVIDLRPVIFSERYGMNEAAENTLDRIIRGDHRSVFGQAVVDAEDDNSPTEIGVWGVEVPELWRVYQYSGLAINSKIATVRDIGLSTSDNPADPPNYIAPRAHHDGIRRIFSPQEEVQEVNLNVPDVSVNGASPAPLVTFTASSDTIAISTNFSTLSGYSATTGKGVLINDSYPRLWWRGSRQPVIYSTRWTGLGTNSASAVIDTAADTYEPNGAIDGIIELIYPECTGIARPVKTVDYVLASDGVNNYQTAIVGNEDGSADDMEMVKWKLDEAVPAIAAGLNLPAGVCFSPGATPTYIYVCDSANNRVVRFDRATLVQDKQWPTLANYPVPIGAGFDLTKHLRYPVDVACDASGNVYVADRDTHRVVKLNAALDTYISDFGDGTPATSYNSTTRLRSPEGVTVSSAGNIFVADTELFRLVKLSAALAYVSQIGNGYSGPGQNQFIQPAGLDCGSVGGSEYVYVADESRIVLVDPVNMTTETILGSLMGAEMQQFFRNQGWVTVVEDAAGNKYAVSCERKQVMKFDSGFQLVATFGEDGVSGWDSEHLWHPRDLIYDANASLLYLADHTQPEHDGNDGRIVVLNSTDLTYVDAKYVVEGLVGLAFLQDAGTAGKLYAAGANKVFKFALPVPGSRGTTSSWTQTWAATAFSGTDIAYVHDLSLNAAGTALYVGDVLASSVYKVNPVPNPPTLTDTCDLAALNKAPEWPPAVGEGAPFGMELKADGSKLYVCGGSIDGATSGGVIRVINTAGMTITDDDLFDNQHWPSGSWPFNIRFNKDGDAYVLLNNRVLLYNQPFVPVTGSIAGDFLYDVADVPVNIDLDLAVEWENVRAVHIKDDMLYVADMTTNTLTSVDAESLVVVGQIGSPAVVGRGMASMAGPGGVAVHEEEIYFTDTFNNRLVKGYRFFPNVERGTGRISYLMAPPATHTVTFQARYAPYQGYWALLNEPSLHGRHYVTDNNTMYLTTLGRGTPTIVTQDGGMGFYANMIAHLPTPTDTPTKSPRVTDEYLFAPEPLPITGETGGTPFARLPVINRYPASAQEINPLYGGGSRFDFTRVLFVQGPGPNWPLATPRDYVQRGFEATGTFPGYDTLETFPLQTISVPRLLFSTAIVEIEGQAYLVVFTTYRAEQRNRLNDGTPIVADVFKLFGNPGIKARY